MNDVEIVEEIVSRKQEDKEEIKEIPVEIQQQQQYKSNFQQFQRDNQNSKEKTLFCINIDQRCTEDILFELFLQVYLIKRNYFLS